MATPATSRATPPNPLRRLGEPRGQDEREDLGDREKRHGQAEGPRHLHGRHRAPRETLVRPHHGAAGEQDQPERRGHVGEDAQQEVQPAYPVQARGSQQARVLQVPLAPAAIAHGGVEQGRRRFLVAAAKIGHGPNRPSAPTQKGRFNEVVAHDVSAPRPRAVEVRQARAPGEGAHAQDGVVAPVVPLLARPPLLTRREDRAV